MVAKKTAWKTWKTAKRTTKAKSKHATRPKARRSNKMSALDAAAKVLAETEQAMTTTEMIEAMAAKGYWKSPGGKTPAATLYSAILRECQKKGKDARFKKVDRGRFALKG